MTVKIKRLDRLHRRSRSKKDLPHNVSGHGKGRWHSRTTLWASKRKARRKRKVAQASRRRNWGV